MHVHVPSRSMVDNSSEYIVVGRSSISPPLAPIYVNITFDGKTDEAFVNITNIDVDGVLYVSRRCQ